MRQQLPWLVVIALGCAWSSRSQSQVPETGAGAGVAAAGAAAPKAGLLGRLFACCNPEKRAKCRRWFCSSPAGQLVNGLISPISGATGGLIPPLCKPDGKDPEKLKMPAESAGGASERIKAEEAGAKAKIADIEFLATKDCKRFPEAEKALIAGLRAEKLECVRLAAAKALMSGCCCTPNIVKALTICVNQSDKDGNLPEESERVRLTAFVALERCLRVCQPAKAQEPPEKPKSKPKDPQKEIELTQVGYTSAESEEIFTRARQTLARGIQVSDAVMRQMSGPANLRDLITGPRYRQSVQPIYPPLAVQEPAPSLTVEPMPGEPSDPLLRPDAPPSRSLVGIFKSAIGR